MAKTSKVYTLVILSGPTSHELCAMLDADFSDEIPELFSVKSPRDKGIMGIDMQFGVRITGIDRESGGDTKTFIIRGRVSDKCPVHAFRGCRVDGFYDAGKAVKKGFFKVTYNE